MNFKLNSFSPLNIAVLCFSKINFKKFIGKKGYNFRVKSHSLHLCLTMVKLVQQSVQSWLKFLRVSSYCTKPETLASLFLPNEEEGSSKPLTSNSLYSRLLYLIRSKESVESVVSILDKWVSEENPINYEDLRIIVKQCRAYRRYNHALQVCFYLRNFDYFF